MILILDCTRQDVPLLKDEFVLPIQAIIQKSGYEVLVLPLNTLTQPDGIEAIILSGTALLDHEFLKIGLPSWILSWNGPVLGICAGMQLLALTCGGELIPNEKIGMEEITVTSDDPMFSGKNLFSAWELHQSGVIVPDTVPVIARSASSIQGIRLPDRPWYGVLFHPEVRNEWIINNFLAFALHR